MSHYHYRLHVLDRVPAQTYPIQKKTLTTEYLRDNCHLRARTSRVAEMLRLRASAMNAFQHFFDVSVAWLTSRVRT